MNDTRTVKPPSVSPIVPALIFAVLEVLAITIFCLLIHFRGSL